MGVSPREVFLQIRRHSAQGSPQGGQRKPPAGMPSRVPPGRRPQPRPARSTLPPQQPITDEPKPAAPSKWKGVVKCIFAVLGILLALAITYVFLLMGEPGEDDQLIAQTTTQEDTIRVPIAASQVSGSADLNPLAVNFGKPVLALYNGDLPLQKATLYDTAFRGGYARRLTLVYAFADGTALTVESVRPTAAVTLLGGDDYRLNVDTLYALAGMDAVRMDSDTQICLIASGSEAVYALRCPVAHAADLAALVNQTALMQPAAS